MHPNLASMWAIPGVTPGLSWVHAPFPWMPARNRPRRSTLSLMAANIVMSLELTPAEVEAIFVALRASVTSQPPLTTPTDHAPETVVIRGNVRHSPAPWFAAPLTIRNPRWRRAQRRPLAERIQRRAKRRQRGRT